MSLDHRQLYRLPWSASDNVLSWLEPTNKCNLACEGCYRQNDGTHKTLAEVQADLDTFNKWRKYDSVSIAGGDPLLHPNIVEIVRMVVADGHKPILNTNGLALTRPLLEDLKRAGLVGLTFHVDSHQGRPGAWRNKSELELNALRYEYASLVNSVGGLSCAFNATIYEDTVQFVPDLVQFAADHIDIIHSVIFIMYRAAITEGNFEYFRNGKKVEAAPLVYAVEEQKQRTDITSPEVVKLIQQRFPDFQPSAYLGGTEKSDSFKWLFTGRFGYPANGKPSKVMGYVGPRFMQLVQNAHHFAKGTYVAYMPQWTLEAGRSAMAMGVVEPGVRQIAKNWLKHLATSPLDARKKMHFQSVMMIQPIDILPDGRQNMCDGCPDVTAHEGQIVWSCRLEEYRQYGGLVSCAPKQRACGVPSGKACSAGDCDHHGKEAPAVKEAPKRAPPPAVS
jgi:hypothetical protein